MVADWSGANSKVLNASTTAAVNGDALQFSYTDLANIAGFTDFSDNFVVEHTSGLYYTLTADAVENSLTATKGHAEFLYDAASGSLYFDADGVGTVADAELVTILGVNTHPTSLAGVNIIIQG